MLQNITVIVLFGSMCTLQTGYAGGVTTHNVPLEVREKLAAGESQELIVVFDDTEVLVQAAQLNREKGIVFDDSATLRFKKERYAKIKADVIAAQSPGKVEVLKDYDVLPLMLVRVRSAEALQTLLSHPSVVRVHEDRKDNMFR